MICSYIELGKWILDLDTGRLYLERDLSTCVKVLPKKPLEFLSVLCCGNGSVVDKDIIVDAVWRGHTSPENITQTVNKLRILLDDYDKSLIVNIPGRGYSLNYHQYNPDSNIAENDVPSINNVVCFDFSSILRFKLFVFVAVVLGLSYFSVMFLSQVSFNDAVLSDEYSSCDVSEENSTIICQ